MREHQPERLSRHASIGRAVSLLVWVHHSGIYVMRWTAEGIPGFEPRKSIAPKRAQELHDECMAYLKKRFIPTVFAENEDIEVYKRGYFR